MTREELVALCRMVPDVGETKHEEFVDYITVIERRRKDSQAWKTERAPYMSVDGRLAMANADHRRQGKKLAFEDPVVLTDTPEELTLMVVIESEIYGRRHGIATSRRRDGSPIEMQHPWEIAETSAIGRALATMGYGLLPGSGLASAEDMLRASERSAPPKRNGLNQRQTAYLVQAYANLHDVTASDAEKALDELCQKEFGHDLSQCDTQEARELARKFRKVDQVSNREAA